MSRQILLAAVTCAPGFTRTQRASAWAALKSLSGHPVRQSALFHSLRVVA